MSLHLDLFEKGRQKQIRKVSEYIQKNTNAEDIVILGGDFNDWSENVSQCLHKETQLQEVFFELHGFQCKVISKLFAAFIIRQSLCPQFSSCFGPVLKRKNMEKSF